MVLSTHFFIPLRIPRTALTPLMHLGGDSGSRMSAGAGGGTESSKGYDQGPKNGCYSHYIFFSGNRDSR